VADPASPGLPDSGGPRPVVTELASGRTAPLEAAMGAEGALVAPRLARGCRCFAAWRDQEVVGYGWVSTAPEWIGELGLEIRPGPGEAYVWNCVTLTPHRRQGVFRALLRALVNWAREARIERLWIGSLEAAGADRAVADAGFEPVLLFEVRAGLGMRRTSTVPASSDADLVEAACSALGVRPGARLGRARRRLH